MSMLTLNSLSFAFGDYDVFLGITASVPNDGKIGLVGPNGIGKTTLLRVIAGLAQPSTGSVSLPYQAPYQQVVSLTALTRVSVDGMTKVIVAPDAEMPVISRPTGTLVYDLLLGVEVAVNDVSVVLRQ